MSMMSQHWLAVRCCCTPGKILGFLKVSEREVRDGCVRRAKRASLPSPWPDISPARIDVFTAEIREFVYLYGSELAIHDGGIPVEEWRKLDGFVEAAPLGSQR